MSLDLFTVTLLTALVVVVSSVVFIVGMVLRKDGVAGRTWGIGFLAALLTVVAYLAWAASPEAWWAVAVGNAAFMCGTGFMWLGARQFNRRAMRYPILSVVVVCVVELVIVAAQGTDGGDWAGAGVMFLGITVFAALGARESLRGEMGHHYESIGLAAVLGLQSLFYLVRSTVFIVLGPQSELFISWFGTVQTSILTITLSIVAVVVTTVLLSRRKELRGSADTVHLEMNGLGILARSSFERILLDMCERAEGRDALVGVVSVRLDDAPAIATAYGSAASDAVVSAFQEGVRSYAPPSAFVGEDGPHRLLVGMQPTTREDATRVVRRIHRGLFDELSGVVGAVIPIVEVSVALSDEVGYRPDDLVRTARESAADDTGIAPPDVLAAG